MPSLNLDTYPITHFSEKQTGRNIQFHFQINSATFSMLVFKDLNEQIVYRIIGIFHEQHACPFCTSVPEDDFCMALFEQREEVFHQLIHFSPNRLRWLLQNVH